MDRTRDEHDADRAADTPHPDELGVAALLAIATDAMSDERDRGRALDSKSASLAGFTGLILALNGVLAKPLFDEPLGSVGDPVAKTCFALAISFLLAAVLLAIVGVLMPQGYRGMGRRQLRNFAAAQTQSMTQVQVHQAMLGAIADIISQDRPVNDCKAKLTKKVAGCLAFGFVAVAGEALTLGARQIGI